MNKNRRITAAWLKKKAAAARRPWSTAKKTQGMDGRVYDSKLEASKANSFFLAKKNGGLLDYLVQVTFRFQSGITWRLDFMLLYPDGSWSALECKGRESRDWIKVKRLLQDEKPWLWERLKVVKNEDERVELAKAAVEKALEVKP